MTEDEDEALRRVRFYGPHDLATGWYVPRVVVLVEQYDPENVSTNTVDILELHNVQQYLEHGFLPVTLSQEDRDRATALIPQIRSAVARHFSSIDDTNFAARLAGIGYEYHDDFLDLLGRNKAFERCNSATVLPALREAGFHLAELLACRRLVTAYDADVREQLLASPRGAEHLVSKHLEQDQRAEICLPASFTPSDARELLERYIDSEDANPNYVGLIATAKDVPAAGIDAKLRLRAKRRSTEMNEKFFEQNTGLKTGCEVGISADQLEPVQFEMSDSDELVARYTYSSRWLEQTCDNPSILNNFVHLFDFVDQEGLLTLPSYPAHLGVMERIMGTTGKTEYKVGAAFRAIDMSTLLQTRLYMHYLETKDVELEQVISWYFQEYLPEEFDARGFSFTPSDPGTSYLQKVRHLFAEMESVANQFALYVRDGQVDRDLLAMGSDQVRYKDLPSLLSGKYIYPTADPEIAGILHALFSDQSSLNYINEDLSADNAAMLLLKHEVTYNDFADFQKPSIDHLINLGVLENDGTRVRLKSLEQFVILRSLFTTQASNYYRLPEEARSVADAMVAKGWVTRRSSLLTDAEGKYYNYFLNGVDFSNGPHLRNKYLHGSQANADGEDAHFHTYVIALRLTVALVIKINDDIELASAVRAGE